MNLEQVKVAHPLPFTLSALQEEDIVAGAATENVFLDLPVGYGKTCIATYIALMREMERIIVVMPPILTLQWETWLNDLRTVGGAIEYRGTKQRRGKLKIEEARWILVSYGLFKNDFARFVSWLKATDKSLVIVDEAQNLKSVASDLYTATKFCADYFEVITMTGTPLSSPLDAYSYISLKSPQCYRDLEQFERYHVKDRDIFKQVTAYDNLDMLNKNLRVNCVHREKGKGGVQEHLRGRTWPVPYRLSDKHMELYHKLMDEQLLVIEGQVFDASTPQRLYHMSQQIIANLDHFSGDPEAKSTTYDLIDTVCDEIAVHVKSNTKLIIWTWFKLTTKSVTEYLRNYNAVAAYSGSDARESVRRFLHDDTCRILVAQPGSAGAGLNPQYVCNEAIFVETPTRTIPFQQSAGRIDREGQPYEAHNRIMIAHGTIQKHLHDNLLSNDALCAKVTNVKALREIIYGG